MLNLASYSASIAPLLLWAIRIRARSVGGGWQIEWFNNMFTFAACLALVLLLII